MQNYQNSFKRIIDIFTRRGGDDRRLRDKLRDKYRLVLMNSETFEEVGAFSVTPLNVYTFLSTLVVGTAILMTLLLAYTPLKRYIPGYGDYRRDSEIAELTKRVKGLEREIEATHNFNTNLRGILTGNIDHLTREEAEKVAPASNDSLSDSKRVQRIPEDDLIRVSKVPGRASSPQSGNAVLSRNSNGSGLSIEQIFFIPPVSGEVMASFNASKDHFGVDVAAPKNTAIKSCGVGVVISSGYTVETGYSIAIQHPDNLVSLYKHNSVLLKKSGDKVQAGEAIAIIGNSGELTTGPHLHFELWHNGHPIDPNDYINFN